MKKIQYIFIFCLQLCFVVGQEVAVCTEEKNNHGWRCNGKLYKDPDYHDPFPSVAFWVDVIIIIAMVVVAGMMSGLTLGLLSLDVMNLEIILKTGDPKDVRNVKKILPLVKKHHQLLVTLLLTNAAAMEALPLALDRLVPEYAAIIISITLVLMFGEIIPQAVCSRYGLRIGAALSWVVWVVMYILFPIAYPLGKALDHFLGKEEGTYFNRSELKELLSMHGNAPAGMGLSIDETTIMRGALELKDKTAEDIMMPISDVFMLSSHEVLDESCLQRIYESKRSRIPIYIDTEGERVSLIGCLLVKSLIAVTGSPKIEDLNLRDLPLVPPDMSLYDLLNLFQEGKSHMAIVDDEGTAKGIVTLEDVIEELIQEEILDESDVTNVRIHHILRIRTPKELAHRSNSDPNPVVSQPSELKELSKSQPNNPLKNSHPKRRSSVAVMDKSSGSDKESEGTPTSGFIRKKSVYVSSPLARSSPRLREQESLESIDEDGEDELVPPGTPLL